LGGWVIRRSSPRLDDLESEDLPKDETTKRCPDCAETVLAAAKVCKHCGYRFAPASTEYELASAKLIAEAARLREADAAADALRKAGAPEDEIVSAKLIAASNALRRVDTTRGTANRE
jgi:ribosomal protein L37AE/L43A